MGRHFDILTFDCYGTLIDWEGGIAAWFEQAAAADRSRGRALRRCGRLRRDRAGRRGQGLPQLPGGAGGDRLARGQALQLVSGARAGAHARGISRYLGAFSRHQPGAGKAQGVRPQARDSFQRGRRPPLLDVVPLDGPLRFARHRAAGPFVQTRPAPLPRRRASRSGKPLAPCGPEPLPRRRPRRSLGIPVAWINRKGQRGPPDSVPDMEVKTLVGLVDRLDRLAAS